MRNASSATIASGTRLAPQVCVLLCLAAHFIAVAGCSRTHYRQMADTQTYNILSQKTRDPRWSPPRLNITPDPRSRFFDPNHPDCPPLPPDDPTAHRYMHGARGIRGWHRWHRNGDLPHVENPEWTTYLGGEPFRCPDFPLPRIDKLGLQEAVELGLIHSREYQEELENMYLSGLALTFQRYRFNVRPLGFLGEPGTELFYEHQPDDASNFQLGTTNFGISKLLPAGGQFVAELTNNTIWMFSGANRTNTASSLAYSLVVPLMAGAGREIAMESLTQGERNVVYAVRDFSRFRKDFYVTIVTGKRALVLPGTAGGTELAFLIRGERSPTVGFNALLFQLQRVRNLRANVRSLQSLIYDLEQLVQAGRSTALDITQLESSLATTQRTLIFLERFYFDELDQFKVQLGLPPDMEIELDDELLEPFQFVNSDLLDLEDQISDLPLTADPGQWKQAAADFKSRLEGLTEFVDLVKSEAGKLQEITDAADAQLQTEKEMDRLEARVGELGDELEEIETNSQEVASLPLPDQQSLLGELRQIRRDMLTVVRELLGLQIDIRVGLVELREVDLAADQVVSIAVANRLDLMNRRAFVVDARRQLEIAADRLEATLNVVVEGAVNMPPLLQNNNPLDFRADESNFRVGISVITPLDRVEARNNYRAAQVAYQRARRNYMAAEDQVKLDVRTHLRSVEAESESFEVGRRALRVAARELDQAVEFAERPDTVSRAGNQGVNISRALENILLAQNKLIDDWVDYEEARLSLFRDMGVMRIGEDGLWIQDDQLPEFPQRPELEKLPPIEVLNEEIGADANQQMEALPPLRDTAD